MAESEDATWLRERLAESDVFMDEFDGQWVAVSDGEVIGSSRSLDEVLANYRRPEAPPLLAFVVGDALQ